MDDCDAGGRPRSHPDRPLYLAMDPPSERAAPMEPPDEEAKFDGANLKILTLTFAANQTRRGPRSQELAIRISEEIIKQMSREWQSGGDLEYQPPPVTDSLPPVPQAQLTWPPKPGDLYLENWIMGAER